MINYKTGEGVCMALWEAGFAGPESAEYGPTMMAAKDLVRQAFQAGREAGLMEAWKAAASPYEGYLHGCDCRARIAAKKEGS